ncbi:MAG: PEP-CTERM system TPR-repeat protein PrsT [Rubrivivax sp.]|nr:PEP-CTERM system TPR-repeat protein PrsT [Rubrivivax sp.]
MPRRAWPAARPNWQVRVGLALLAAVLVSCGASQETRRLASVEQRLAADDVDGALIEARSAVQAEDKSGPARLLLARVLLAKGDLNGAEIEIDRAARLGAAPAQLAPARAQLLLGRRQPAEVVRQFKAGSFDGEKVAPELRLHLAQAHRELGELDAAQAELAQVLAASPTHAPALVLRARLAAERGDSEGARRLAEQVLVLHPDNAPAWVLKGDVLARLANDAAGALQAYRKASELRPGLVVAYSGAIELLLRRGEVAAAAEAVQAMARALPNNGTAMYYQAVVAFLQGQYVRAREFSYRLLRGAPDQLAIVYLAGVVHARLGETHQAMAQLTRAVLLAPAAHEPRRELAAVQARAGMPRDALDTLRPVLAADSKDPSVWTTAGRAHLELGDFAAGDAAFARAGRLAPGAGAVRLEIGRSLIAQGEVDLGLRELQVAGQSEDAAVEAMLEQVAVHMRRGDAAAALKAAATLAQRRPDAAVPHHVRGRILQARGDRAGARAAYEVALTREPRHLAAVSSLAELDLAEDRPAEARRRYEALLKLEPRSAPAMMALAVITRREGASRADAARWVDRAVAASPADAAIWRQAIALHRKDSDEVAALARAQAALVALPDHPEILADLAAVQLAGGERRQAVTHLLRLVHLLPNSADAHLRLAEAQLAAGDRAAASDHVLRAYKLAPMWPPAVRAAVRIAALEGDARKVASIAERTRTQAPGEALGWLVQAEYEMARGQWPRAVALLREAHAVQPGTPTAVALHRALVRPEGAKASAAAGGPAARELEAAWLKSHPGDVVFLAYLGRGAASRGDYAQAVARLRQAHAADPRDAALLNDLAYAQVMARDPQALATAERARRLAPYLPAVLDTLAAALAAGGQVGPAIARQTEALALVPKSVPMRVRLAQLYADAGQAAKAREEAQRVLAMQPREPERAAAQQVLARIGG